MKIAVVFVDAFTFHLSFLRLAPQKGVLNLRSLLLTTAAQKALQKWKIHWKCVFVGALWRLYLSRLILKRLHAPHTRRQGEQDETSRVCVCCWLLVLVGVKEQFHVVQETTYKQCRRGIVKMDQRTAETKRHKQAPRCSCNLPALT